MTGPIQQYKPEAYEMLDRRDEDQILAEMHAFMHALNTGALRPLGGRWSKNG